MDILNLSALELGQKIKTKEVTVLEALEAVLNNIEANDGDINAFISLGEKEMLKARAADLQKGIDDGIYTSPLAGVPMAIKDNMCTRDFPTTCASHILENFMAPYNAEVVERLIAAGALIIGKLNMDEFAMGGTTETSYAGICKNPWDLSTVPGGSSGGSAAAVAKKMSFYTLGSDTGGSIRQPCSFCNTSGIKPTYGSVSRYGLIAYGSSLDQIGPIAQDIKTCAAIMDIIAGSDEKDSTSIPDINFNFANLKGNVAGKKIGVPSNYLGEGIDAEVAEAINNAATKFSELGAEVEYFEMPMMEYAVPAYYIIASAEASSNLSRFDGIKYGYHPKNFKGLQDLYLTARSEGFGTEVKRRIMLGSFVLSSGYYDAYYHKALKVRSLITDAFNEKFKTYDAILMPVAPTTAPKIGDSQLDPVKNYLADIYTVSINLVGVPAVSIPCGFSSANMPIGMQLVGKAMTDEMLVDMAISFQDATDYHKKTLGGGK